MRGYCVLPHICEFPSQLSDSFFHFALIPSAVKSNCAHVLSMGGAPDMPFTSIMIGLQTGADARLRRS
jgi:hypothetical protein